jgi:hypothetical protein
MLLYAQQLSATEANSSNQQQQPEGLMPLNMHPACTYVQMP